MFCNHRNQNNNHNNCNKLSSKTLCLYTISTIIISIIVFIVALSYSKSLLRLGHLETDVKEILQVLSHMSSKSKIKEANRCRDTTAPQQSVVYEKDKTCSATAIEETVKKYTENLNKEIIETKKQINNLKEMYKCTKPEKTSEPIAPVNYALESLGAKIECVKDVPYYTDNPILTYMGFHFSNSPRQILCESTSPGNCYAFRGTESTVIINLMRPVHIESISIEHILDTMTPSGDISNAPKEFEVYGLKSPKNGKEILLGKFSYNIQKREAIQYFTTSGCVNKSFTYVKFKFLTNNGQINYTCVYRVGVHGRLGSKNKIEKNEKHGS